MPFQILPQGVPLSKRLFDLVVTLAGMVLAVPVMLIVAVVIRVVDGTPILFLQPRPGHGGRVFTVIKFRTMRNAYDRKGRPLPDKQRLSRLGSILRAASLDELPELINVLKGEMSLVGPRPLLVKYLERYSPEQARRHAVLPGITGWAQINGRNNLSWEDKFRLDVWYVDHWNFWLDIKILALTVWKVIKREGIRQPGQVSSEEFMGDQRHTK
jgi:sugar transferase EpsL